MNIILIFMIFLLPFQLFTSGQADPHRTTAYVDLEDFAGKYYVMALIPTFIEKGITNAQEEYILTSEDTLEIRFRFKKEGKWKEMSQKGWVVNKETGAEWEVQPLWPFKLPYYILERGLAYEYTVVATGGFNYLWIMARQPFMDETELEIIIQRMAARGFDKEKIVYMQHKESEK